ncbi:MAG: DUF1573 domain-containing protein [Candidatus Hydrogenedentes bacterium]|nr:DUF1573 domain-containing protein [Candidatus Hydrogenedentota bacterium]
MKKRSALILLMWGFIIAAPILALAGCGGNDFESDEEFIESLHKDGAPKGEADGTMPPVGEPMQVSIIRLETNDLDLGTVKNDQIHHHKLKVFNDGKMPLKITKIDTTCACTMGNIPPERATIQPGEESWIDVTLDPDRVPGFSSHKILTITSTDPAQPQVTVDVRASIEPEYYIETEELVLGEFNKGDVVERRVRFRQIQDAPANVTGVEVLTVGPRAPRIPGLTARVEVLPEDQWKTPGKSECDIIITTGPEISAGAFERNVVLLTDVKRLPRHRIHVTGTAKAPYTPAPVYPERAMLRPGADGANFTARATFVSTGPLALAIAATSSPAITASVVPGSSPNEVHVDMLVPDAEARSKPFDETVSVQVTAEGNTYTEIVGIRNLTNEENAEGSHAH